MHGCYKQRNIQKPTQTLLKDRQKKTSRLRHLCEKNKSEVFGNFFQLGTLFYNLIQALTMLVLCHFSKKIQAKPFRKSFFPLLLLLPSTFPKYNFKMRIRK